MPHLAYDGPERLVANQLFRADLTVRLDVAAEAGTVFRIAMRHVSDMADAQVDHPEWENFVSIETDVADVRFELEESGSHMGFGGCHPWNRGFGFILAEGALPAGSTLRIRMGDGRGGSPGFRCQTFGESAFRFRLGVRDPDGAWTVLGPDDCPAVPVEGNACTAVMVRVVRPTGAGPVRIWCKPEDRHGNTAGAVPERVALLLDGVRPVAEARLEPNACASVTVDPPGDGAFHTVVAATDDGAVWNASNPFGPTLCDGRELFWGEIHAQTGLCDGTNPPAEILRYAREAAGLDFAALSSHDFELTRDDWEEIRAAVRDAHAPREFVTFLGVEWSGKTPRGGDNNIYFLDDDGPLLYSAPFGRSGSPWDPAKGEVDVDRDLAETIRAAGDRPLLVVPHCGGRPCNLDFYDERVMPLFEIHSCHQTYEHVAAEAIRRGLHFGFVGGSDDHRGCLGDSHATVRDRFFSSHSGLVGVWAEDLTRESLWDAFFEKRVYATNGIRPVLHVDLDDVPMGGTLRMKRGGAATLRVRAELDGFLERIEVVVGTEALERFLGGRHGNKTVAVDEACEIPAPEASTCCYVVVRQTNGGAAWSSPVRMEVE